MPKPALPPLAALRSFESAARHQSFRRAAEELNVTQSAISHQISGLEEQLGVKLFHRQARRVELTEAGTLYFPYLRDAFERIALGTALVGRRSVAGDLTIQVYITVAVRWLMPRLHDFNVRHPDIHVRISASQLDWEFDVDSVDAGMIFTAQPAPQSLAYAHLFDARLVAVCSPDLLQASGAAIKPRDLDRHALIHNYTVAEDWPIVLAALGVPHVKGRAAAKFDSWLLAIEAALDGQGFAVVPHFLVAADLRTGRLAAPFATTVAQPGSWYLACRKERANEPRISRFRDWLIAEVLRDPVI